MLGGFRVLWASCPELSPPSLQQRRQYNMWLFTDFGFYSAVQHRSYPDKLLVRARAKQDLERLMWRYPFIGQQSITVTPAADYRYRILVSKEAWAQALGEVAKDIDYDNFKDSVHSRMGHERYDVCGDVWLAARKITDLEQGRGEKYKWNGVSYRHVDGQEDADDGGSGRHSV